MLTIQQLKKYQKKLHALRAGLDTRVSALRDEAYHGAGAETGGGLSNAPIHLADLSDQESQAVVNFGLAENEAARRQAIDDALMRVEEGKFGICEQCHRAIDGERLEAIPYSRLCIRCAERSQSFAP